MGNSFPLQIKVINGEVQEFPVTFYFKCDMLRPAPVAATIYRYFDDAMCSIAMRIFYLQYGTDLFGSTQFKTTDDFWNYWSALCNGLQPILLLLNGCNMIINGKNVSVL